MSSVTVTPERSLEQRLGALARANGVRTYRAVLKREIKSDGARALDAFMDGREDPRLMSMKIADLLISMPRMGPVKAGALLRRLAISPSKTLAGMTTRQRAAVYAAMVDHVNARRTS